MKSCVKLGRKAHLRNLPAPLSPQQQVASCEDLNIGHPMQEFDSFLQDVIANPAYSPERRLKLLEDWERGPSARKCQPREEHLLPLHVIAGAAHGAQGRVTYDEELMGVKVSSFQFE